jgi:hypothetical protein
LLIENDGAALEQELGVRTGSTHPIKAKQALKILASADTKRAAPETDIESTQAPDSRARRAAIGTTGLLVLTDC